MIRRMAIWLAAAHLVLLAAATPQAAPPRSVLVTVERVADGDTLMATSEDSTRLRIRLLGIDAPEIPHRGKPGQTYGVEARQQLVRLVLNRVVRIELFGSDVYRRLLAVIWHDGANVNVEMVRDGFAEVYRGARCQAYCRELADAERWAQRDRVGIWAQDRYESPAAYRRRNHPSFHRGRVISTVSRMTLASSTVPSGARALPGEVLQPAHDVRAVVGGALQRAEPFPNLWIRDTQPDGGIGGDGGDALVDLLEVHLGDDRAHRLPAGAPDRDPEVRRGFAGIRIEHEAAGGGKS